MAKSFFISYSHSDEELAEGIENLLKGLNIYSFRDKTGILPGDDISEKVKNEIQSSEAVIVIISPGSFKSQWVSFEIGFAVALGKKVIPYLTHPQLDLPAGISNISYVADLATLKSYVTQYSLSGQFLNEFPSDLMPDITSFVNSDFVMVVGGANREYILTLKDPLRLGSKHKVNSFPFVGGSGVNITLRLLNAGIPVIPILEVGNDDMGKEIQKEIIESASKTRYESEITTFVSGSEFFVPKLKTPDSTIIIEEDNRTIFTSEPTTDIDFKAFVRNRIENHLPINSSNIKAVAIGHIHSDRNEPNSPHAGECTKYLFSRFGSSAMVYANFGESQIRLGLNYWKTNLSQIDILQLNLNEMKTFFTPRGKRPLSLFEIINEIISNQLNAIITLDRFGAIGISKENPNQVIIAWPFDIDNIVDTTGAGDAFGAGLIANILGKLNISFNQLYTTVDDARFWASFACTTPGGAYDCPTRIELESHKKKLLGKEETVLAIEDISSIKQILRTFDRAL